MFFFFFFFNDTATTEIYTLSLHDALPISNDRFDDNFINAPGQWGGIIFLPGSKDNTIDHAEIRNADRKSTRLNSSHPSRSRMPSSA